MMSQLLPPTAGLHNSVIIATCVHSPLPINPPLCVQSVFTRNVALSSVGGGVLYSQLAAYPRFEGCNFQRNAAPRGEGGAFKVYGPALLELVQCTLSQNWALRPCHDGHDGCAMVGGP